MQIATVQNENNLKYQAMQIFRGRGCAIVFNIFTNEIKNTRFILTVLAVILLALFGGAIIYLIFETPNRSTIPEGLMALLTTLVGAIIAVVSVAYNSYFKGREEDAVARASGAARADDPCAAKIQEGLEHYSRGSFDDAILAFREAVKLNEASACALYNLGLALKKKKNYQEAAEALEKALSLDNSLTLAAHERDEAMALAKTLKVRE